MQKSNENEAVNEFRAIRKDYAFNPSVFSEDSPRVSRLKDIINNRLDIVDRTIILLYVECQSFRELGRKLGLSHTTARKEVVRIKNLILKEYEIKE